MSHLVQLMPDEAQHLALQLHRGGALEEAEFLYGRILEAAPDSADALHFLALLCHQQKRLDEAAQLIRRIVEIHPENADAHNNLGNVYDGMGDEARAEECYRRAIELDPNHGAAHNNLGVILTHQRLNEEAVAAYRKAVELSPDSAEFHYNLGNALRRKGELDGAIDAYLSATKLDQDHLGAWQGLARALRLAGRLEEAVTVFDNLLRLHPENPVFSYLRAACVGDQTPERAPDDYVKQIFDDAASYFDRHLEGLEYRAPSLLAEALSDAITVPEGSLDVLDAGCGTGLCGPLLRPYARKLVGIDLSEGMLQKAAERQLYHDLYQAELTAFLRAQSEEYDLIVSADTLCYFGELGPVIAAAAGALRSGGILAFTLEDSGEGESFRLNSSGRYSHSRRHVEDAAGSAGLVIKEFVAAVLRNEGNEAVTGHLVIAGKEGI